MLTFFRICMIWMSIPGAAFLESFHRQYLAPCEAEVAVSGYERVRSIPSNYWSGLTIQRTSRLFLGGLPLSYLPYKVRLQNYCIGEYPIMEIIFPHKMFYKMFI